MYPHRDILITMKGLSTFLLIFSLIFSSLLGGSLLNAQNTKVFQYPPELLNSQNQTQSTTTANNSTIFFDSPSSPATTQSTPVANDPYEVRQAPTVTDQLRDLQLFNPASGIPSGVEEQVSVKFSPANPQDSEPFTMRVDSFSTDLNRATFTWKVNDSIFSSGRGLNVENFRAPESGGRINIELNIATIEGSQILKTYTIAPAKVDLYYEADTYTFPFYQGKRIYTHQSDAIVHAFPYINEGGSFLERNELSYIWEVDNRVVQDKSGYGKSSFTHNSGLLSQDVKISVTVSSIDNPSVAEGDIFISPKAPDVLLFENHPLYGIITKNMVNSFYELTTPDVFVLAVPLFFSIRSRESSDLDYSWNLNGERLSIFDGVSQIAFRNSKNEEGEARVRVNIKNRRSILQSVSVTGQLIFSRMEEFIETAGQDFF